MKIKENAKTWTIRYTLPKTVTCAVPGFVNAAPRIFEYNHCSVIVSPTVGRAVEILTAEFPDATIVSVNPGSTGPILVDTDVIQ